MTENLHTAAAQLCLSLDDLDPISVARSAISQGYGNTFFERLMQEHKLGDAEARTLLKQALEQAGVLSPTPRQAVYRLARLVAQQILNGDTDPLEGAHRIWHIATQTDEEFPELDTFLYATYEAPERPEARQVFVRGVLDAARDLVTRQ